MILPFFSLLVMVGWLGLLHARVVDEHAKWLLRNPWIPQQPFSGDIPKGDAPK